MPTDDDRSLLGTLITWAMIALLGLALLKLTFWAVGAAIGLGALVLAVTLRLLPLLLIGWLALKIWRAVFGRRDEGFDPV
jgi:hypothetical protein